MVVTNVEFLQPVPIVSDAGPALWVQYGPLQLISKTSISDSEQNSSYLSYFETVSSRTTNA